MRLPWSPHRAGPRPRSTSSRSPSVCSLSGGSGHERLKNTVWGKEGENVSGEKRKPPAFPPLPQTCHAEPFPPFLKGFCVSRIPVAARASQSGLFGEQYAFQRGKVPARFVPAKNTAHGSFPSSNLFLRVLNSKKPPSNDYGRAVSPPYSRGIAFSSAFRHNRIPGRQTSSPKRRLTPATPRKETGETFLPQCP